MALAFNLFEIFEYRDHFCFFCLHVLSTFGEKNIDLGTLSESIFYAGHVLLKDCGLKIK